MSGDTDPGAVMHRALPVPGVITKLRVRVLALGLRPGGGSLMEPVSLFSGPWLNKLAGKIKELLSKLLFGAEMFEGPFSLQSVTTDIAYGHF